MSLGDFRITCKHSLESGIVGDVFASIDAVISSFVVVAVVAAVVVDS